MDPAAHILKAAARASGGCVIDGCEPLDQDPAMALLDLARAHPAPGTRADLLAVLVRVPLPETLRPRLAVALLDELAEAGADVFPDLARTAVRTGDRAATAWVRAFAASPGARRHAALDALTEVRDPDVVIELERLSRSANPAERGTAERMLARYDGGTGVAAPPPLPEGPSYHGMFSVLGPRWFELLQQHPPVHATTMPPDRLGSLFMERLLDTALAPPLPEPDLLWPQEIYAVTAVRLARELNGAYLPDRHALFRRYRLARSGEGPDIAVSAQSLAELAGVGAPASAVVDLLWALLSPDPDESADAAAFLRTAVEQAGTAREVAIRNAASRTET